MICFVNDLVRKLGGGDRRSIGRADEIAREVSSNPKLLLQVFEALWSADPIVRMRAGESRNRICLSAGGTRIGGMAGK